MLIQKCRKSFLLFNKNFKPGILCNGNYCIAVKCKLFGECFNFINEELLHVIGDKNLAHRACFCKSINEKYPTRICFYTEDGYIDMGWGLAKKIDSNGRYIFDISKEVKERYKDYEYPIYPGEIILKSNWTMFDNWIYESKLEAKYAKFFTLLGIPFVQQPPPIPSINSEWWRIDFMLWPLNEDKKCLVEIKPGRPYDIEEYKCEVASEYVSPIAIVLLYGEMEVPFLYDENKGRPNGVHGIKWYLKNGKPKRKDIIIKIKDEQVVFEPRKKTSDMSWSHPTLLKSYIEANTSNEYITILKKN
tara:strand:- start:56 stop:964 length:909 start_codon:yes stop_codon:yes gene_type:complete